MKNFNISINVNIERGRYMRGKNYLFWWILRYNLEKLLDFKGKGKSFRVFKYKVNIIYKDKKIRLELGFLRVIYKIF